jgi:hypothetical protein
MLVPLLLAATLIVDRAHGEVRFTATVQPEAMSRPFGRVRHPLAELITEKDRKAPALDFRYGGNERFQKDFRSGCIICLYSCPGGAVGNHAHPIREYVRDGVACSSIAKRLPPKGTKVTIVLKPRLEMK